MSRAGALRPTTSTFIGLDWGSSHLRAYLLDRDGAVLDQRASADGASRLAPDASADERAAAFEHQLRSLIGDWLASPLPLLACGMVGSAHGWREAPYLPCPLDLDDLARHLSSARGSGDLQLWIVPGVSLRAGEAPDVMRGEETKLIGVLAHDSSWRAAATVVMPGTHSKWIRIRDSRLVAFATSMTGELFDVLRSHSVLSRSLAEPATFDRAAFDEGIAAVRHSGGTRLAHQLFGVRTRQLFGERSPAALHDYLSGLLIGHELAGELPGVPATQPLVLAGGAELCARYRHALAAFDREPTAVVVDAVTSGLAVIARARGLV